MGNKNSTKKQNKKQKQNSSPQEIEQQVPSSFALGRFLHQVVSQGETAKIQSVLEQGVDKNVLNQAGQSPMYVALFYGHADKGAQIIPSLEYNSTPLHIAIKLGHQEICQMLLREVNTFPSYKNVKDERGYTPLHIACLKGNLNVVNMLMSAQAQIDVKGQDGKTPLSICIENMHTDIQKVLEQNMQKNSHIENNHLTHKRDISEISLNQTDNSQESSYSYLERKLIESSSYLPVISSKELTYLDQINKGSSCLLFRGR